MGSFSIGHWLIVLIIIGIGLALPIWFTGRITDKAGLSPVWKWAFLFPLAGLVVLWVIAFSEWPAEKAKAAAAPPAAG